jgi:hypothetical protein
VHGAPGLARWTRIDTTAQDRAKPIADQSKSRYHGATETKMAEKRKKTPIKRAR